MKNLRIKELPTGQFIIQKLCEEKQNLFAELLGKPKNKKWISYSYHGELVDKYYAVYDSLKQAEKALEIIKGKGIIKYYK